MAQLAQINIAKLTHPIDHPKIAEFADNLDKINKLAERSEGFIWRLIANDNTGTVINAYDDPLIIVNMSVWNNINNLRHYVYRSEHLEFFIKRKNWFQKMEQAHMALWWVQDGHVPTLAEAQSKLSLIDKVGESDQAFTFRKIFDPPA